MDYLLLQIDLYANLKPEKIKALAEMGLYKKTNCSTWRNQKELSSSETYMAALMS